MRTSSGMLTETQLRRMIKKVEKKFNVKMILRKPNDFRMSYHCLCKWKDKEKLLEISWRAISWGWVTYWEYDDFGNPIKECKTYHSRKEVMQSIPATLEYLAVSVLHTAKD